MGRQWPGSQHSNPGERGRPFLHRVTLACIHYVFVPESDLVHPRSVGTPCTRMSPTGRRGDMAGVSGRADKTGVAKTRGYDRTGQDRTRVPQQPHLNPVAPPFIRAFIAMLQRLASRRGSNNHLQQRMRSPRSQSELHEDTPEAAERLARRYVRRSQANFVDLLTLYLGQRSFSSWPYRPNSAFHYSLHQGGSSARRG